MGLEVKIAHQQRYDCHSRDHPIDRQGYHRNTRGILITRLHNTAIEIRVVGARISTYWSTVKESMR